MRDPATDQLVHHLQRHPGEETADDRLLWIADENALHNLAAVTPAANLTLVSNRFDVAQRARELGFTARFSDFDFSYLADNSIRTVIYRISKERPVVHHILNEAWRVLAPGGELLLSGLKQEGIKTYIEKAAVLFGNTQSRKVGMAYLGTALKHHAAPAPQALDSKQYSDLRLIETSQLDFYSKPGLFGWDKIDQGSAFLVEQLPRILLGAGRPPKSLLDLGCGYGYLTMMTRDLALERRVATDNNAAALLAITKNAEHFGLQIEVVADDSASQLAPGFDLILCNPPFHQGFSVDGALTDKFLRQTRRLLSPQGMAVFVVNQFIPLERAAQKYFPVIDTVGRNPSFKLICLAPG